MLSAAEFAMTAYGHYQRCQKHMTIVQQIARLKGFRIDGLPAIEVYRTTRVDAKHEMNHTEIYLPVSRTRK